MADYSLILFDLDGTLADTHQLIFDSFNFILRKYTGAEKSPKEILSYFGPTEEVCIRNIIGTEGFDDMWADFIDYYRSHLEESSLFHGVRELLVFLKNAGKRIGVFTAKGSTTTELTLEYYGLWNLFDIVVTGSLVRNHKPHPEGVHLALEKLGVPASETIVVGDSPSDYKAATSAGTGFIAVTYDSASRSKFDGIDCQKAESVAALKSLLASLNTDVSPL